MECQSEKYGVASVSIRVATEISKQVNSIEVFRSFSWFLAIVVILADCDSGPQKNEWR